MLAVPFLLSMPEERTLAVVGDVLSFEKHLPETDGDRMHLSRGEAPPA
jgi:hypothetical protein